MKRIVLLCLGLASVGTPALAQDKSGAVAHVRPRAEAIAPDAFSRIRLKGNVWVGETAPDFELTSSTGRGVGLSELRGEWLLLRFADNRQEFAGLAAMKDQLDQMGVRLLAICGDKPQTLRSFVQRSALPFEILSDATGEVSAVYGFYDPLTSSSRTGIVIVDRRGIVRMALQGGAPADQVVELTRFTLTSLSPRP